MICTNDSNLQQRSASPSMSFMSTPSVSMSVSVSTPHTNVPSVHSVLDTVPSERGAVLDRDIGRPTQHIDDLDLQRGEENRVMADMVRRIRDELYDFCDFLHQRES